jgi:hypothetical protein
MHRLDESLEYTRLEKIIIYGIAFVVGLSVLLWHHGGI